MMAGGPRVHTCYNCRNPVALHDDYRFKGFLGESLMLHLDDLFDWGRTGRAFLFSHAMNIVTGPKEDRQLMTGLYTVADIYCSDCCDVLGWKYKRAYEETQRYKEGKFALEKSKIILENSLLS